MPDSRTHDFSPTPDFPLLDLAAFAAADAAGQARIAREVDRICTRTGFLAVTGHGVPEEIIQGLWARMRGFFDQSPDEKHKVAPPPGGPYGYRDIAESW